MFTCSDNIWNFDSFFMGNEANDTKDDNTGIHRRRGVAKSDEQSVTMCVSVETVVRRQQQLTAHSHSQTEEDLARSGIPNLNISQPVPVGNKVELHPLRESIQSCNIAYHDGQDNVGEKGGEVDDFAIRLDSLDERSTDQGPAKCKTSNLKAKAHT